VKSFLSYLGGKSLLTRKIIPLLPEHTCYCEVFAGAAWLLFKKEESEIEIINDINSDLVTLYRVIKHHLQEFIRYFKWILVARDEFDRFKSENPDTLTDIQRAVRFYYLLKSGYGAKVIGQTFALTPTRPPRVNLLRIEEELSAAHLRLSRVYIENMHYAKLIERVDRPNTCFYIDPPYYNCEDYYGKGIFSREDFTLLASLLAGINGKFIMSVNDVPEIRTLYSAFNIQEVDTSYSLAGADRKKGVTELLITNF
jgi:DNA adenine methylase